MILFPEWDSGPNLAAATIEPPPMSPFLWSEKKTNTGIEIWQCRYLNFISKKSVWRAEFFQRDAS
jgi:hypothetical protein